jgi:hypothetical protein
MKIASPENRVIPGFLLFVPPGTIAGQTEALRWKGEVFGYGHDHKKFV